MIVPLRAGLLAGLWLSVLAPASAATLSLEDLDGNARSLEEHRGQVVVLNFWATWCLPCVEEMPLLAALQESHGPRGVQVIGVSTDAPDRIRLVRRFVRRHDLDFPVWVGGTVEQMRGFGAGEALPATVILDRDGRIAMRILGPVEPGDLEERVEWLLGDRSDAGPDPLLDRFATAPHDHAGEHDAGARHDHGDDHEHGEEHQHGGVGLEGASLVPS